MIDVQTSVFNFLKTHVRKLPDHELIRQHVDKLMRSKQFHNIHVEFSTKHVMNNIKNEGSEDVDMVSSEEICVKSLKRLYGVSDQDDCAITANCYLLLFTSKLLTCQD